jgi:hypothetical protein
VPLDQVDIGNDEPPVRHYPQDITALALVPARNHDDIITFSDSLHGLS